MTEVLEVIVEALVDHPEQVRVTEVSRQGGNVHLEVQVAPGDLGKVIGKSGRIAHAIRAVVRVAANRQHLRAMVDFVS